jgi:hypothetical protein
MKRQPMTRLFDDTEYLPLFAGLPVAVAEQPAPAPTDASGPASTWDWAGTLEQPDPDAELRALWTAQGVPLARQNEILADITAKAQPGAHVGPFVIGGGYCYTRDGQPSTNTEATR